MSPIVKQKYPIKIRGTAMEDTRILKDIERVFEMEDTEEDVNSLFSDR